MEKEKSIGVVPIEGGGMSNTLLEFMTDTINSRIGNCRSQLEIEEKNKAIAFLQGNLWGYKTLLDHICTAYSLPKEMSESNGEVLISKCSNSHVRSLAKEAASFVSDTRWAKVLEAVDNDIEELKSFLFYEDSKMRELYLTKGKYQGITVYDDIISGIKAENEQRKQELDFEQTPIEEPHIPEPQSGIVDELAIEATV